MPGTASNRLLLLHSNHASQRKLSTTFDETCAYLHEVRVMYLLPLIMPSASGNVVWTSLKLKSRLPVELNGELYRLELPPSSS